MSTDEEPNVNLDGSVSTEVNIKRLGQQQKDILRLLYESQKVWQQVGIIEELHGEVTDSRKASVSRSISRLQEHDLIFRQHCLYYPKLDCWCVARPHWGIAEVGERFVEQDDRFPDIDGDSA